MFCGDKQLVRHNTHTKRRLVLSLVVHQSEVHSVMAAQLSACEDIPNVCSVGTADSYDCPREAMQVKLESQTLENQKRSLTD